MAGRIWIACAVREPASAVAQFLPVLGAAVAVVALLTALINHRSATVNWRTATATAGTAIASEQLGERPMVQLPARPHLVYRDDAMHHAIELIRSGEAVLSIEGEIGAGKSAVAKELAHRLTTSTGRGPESPPGGPHAGAR